MIRAAAVLFLALCLLSCSEADPPDPVTPEPGPIPDPPELVAARERMVETQVKKLGVTSLRILETMRWLPRHAFLPEAQWGEAYEDRAVRRPDGETVTAPDLSGAMLQALDLREDARVLECGTRTGWMTALLAGVAGEVFTLDARPEATERARRLLERIGVEGVRFRTGDPLAGWPEKVEFDAVVVNGSVPHIPLKLYQALVPGGAILAPVGQPGENQTLILVLRGDRVPLAARPLLTVRFGPLAR